MLAFLHQEPALPLKQLWNNGAPWAVFFWFLCFNTRLVSTVCFQLIASRSNKLVMMGVQHIWPLPEEISPLAKVEGAAPIGHKCSSKGPNSSWGGQEWHWWLDWALSVSTQGELSEEIVTNRARHRLTLAFCLIEKQSRWPSLVVLQSHHAVLS